MSNLVKLLIGVKEHLTNLSQSIRIKDADLIEHYMDASCLLVGEALKEAQKEDDDG